jgi:hypothetical protein
LAKPNLHKTQRKKIRTRQVLPVPKPKHMRSRLPPKSKHPNVESLKGAPCIQIAHAQGVQSPQGIYSYDLTWLNIAIASAALIVSAIVLIRGFSKVPKEADR